MARSYGNNTDNESTETTKVKWYQNPSMLVGIVFLIIFVVISGVNIVSAIHKGNETNARINELQQAYDELSEKITGMREGDEMTEEDVKEALHTASIEGQLIADVQNGWMIIPISGVSSTTNDQTTKLVTEYHDTMVKYCPNSDVNIKRIWFTYISDCDTVDNLPYKWEFNSMYSYAGDTIPVMWTLFEGNDLYAYVTGNYDVASKTFSNLNLCYTAIGRQRINERTTGVTPVDDTGSPSDATMTDATEETDSNFVDGDEAEKEAEKLQPTTESTTETTESTDTSETTNDENSNDGEVTE